MLINGFIVTKFYPSEGQPKSTSDEFPSRAVFGNSRQFQYGGCSFDTIHANEQSRHVDKLDKHVIIYLARKRNIFNECLKSLTFNVVVDFQFIIAATPDNSIFKLYLSLSLNCIYALSEMICASYLQICLVTRTNYFIVLWTNDNCMMSSFLFWKTNNSSEF